jgi:uncharacterized membrane protein
MNARKFEKFVVGIAAHYDGFFTMSRTSLAGIPLLLVLAACGGPTNEPAPSKKSAVEAKNESSAKGPVRGILKISDGLATLHECGTPAEAALTFADSSGALAEAFASLEAKPADGIYVELSGAPGTLLRARNLSESAACGAPVFEGEFVANGNEPFWAIEIRDNGIVFSSLELPKGRVYPYAFTRTATGAVVYATKTEEPAVSTLEISLEPARCIDSMSGELRSHKAHVTRDGHVLSGCAFAGIPHGEFGDAPLDELNRFAGTYPHAVHLWDDSAIHHRLKALLGSSMKPFLANMNVQSPLMKDRGIFYVTGNKPHQGSLDNAIFLADPATDTLAVILYTKGVRRDFKEGGRDVALPAEVVTTIRAMETH